MDTSTLLPRSWKACAAAASLLVVTLVASAADVARVDVVGQMPLRQACPKLDEADLASALSTAWDEAQKPSAVAVTFKVQRHHVFDVAPETASPRAFHQIRRAVHGLSCDGGDGAAHSVRFVLRFVDGVATRVAMAPDVTVDD